jgi:hypothetical protein
MREEDLATMLADARASTQAARADARRYFWLELMVILLVGLGLGAASFLNRRDIDRLQEVVGVAP